MSPRSAPSYPVGPLATVIGLLVLATQVVAQDSFSGRVVDDEGGRPLAFAHVGIPAAGTGAITDEAGGFTLDARPGDSLRVSMIGYASATLAIPPASDGPLVVRLRARAYALPGASVRARLPAARELLASEPSRVTTGHSGGGDYGVGEEFGRVVALPPGAHLLTGAGFHLRFNRLDSVRFRVNVYGLGADGSPAVPLNPVPAYATATRKQERVDVDFDAPVRAEGDVVVAVEVVRLWYRPRGDNALFFSHDGLGGARGVYRPVSQAAWRSEGAPPVAMWVRGVGVGG